MLYSLHFFLLGQCCQQLINITRTIIMVQENHYILWS
jgi:hypothetical protein